MKKSESDLAYCTSVLPSSVMPSSITLFLLILLHFSSEVVLGSTSTTTAATTNCTIYCWRTRLLCVQSDPFPTMAYWDGANKAWNLSSATRSTIVLLASNWKILICWVHYRFPLQISAAYVYWSLLTIICSRHSWKTWTSWKTSFIENEWKQFPRINPRHIRLSVLSWTINLSSIRLQWSISAFFFANCTSLINGDLSENIQEGSIPGGDW